jgi:hypothetical protein
MSNLTRTAATPGAASPAGQHHDEVPGPRAATTTSPGVTSPGPAATPAASHTDVEYDQHQLVMGYLSAVAHQLDQRGIAVRAVLARGLHPLSGILTLRATRPVNPPQPTRWTPALLRWEPDRGWSATLLLDPDARRGEHAGRGDRPVRVARYLPGPLVPPPVTVAHFAAALATNPDTVWATATFRPPRQVDRRLLIMQLSRYALPEPG